MCKRCDEHFAIHDVKELNMYLYSWVNKELMVECWLKRKYMNNLIYLEWLHNRKVDKIKDNVKI
jgi:hypothetical protein